MDSLSIWHWLVLLIFLVVPLLLVGGLVWLIVRLSRRSAPTNPPGHLAGADIRLSQLDGLLAQGHITRDEYDRQRAAIISGV